MFGEKSKIVGGHKEDSSESFDLNVLRDDVNRLRVENKLLARNLHTERYVSKQQLQRTLSDLRGENYRLQRDNEVGRNRVFNLAKEVESHENAFQSKRQEMDKTAEEVEALMAENQDASVLLEALSEDNHAKRMDNLEILESNSKITKQIQDLTLKYDRLNSGIKNLSSDINTGQEEIAELQSTVEKYENEIETSRMVVADTVKLQKSLELDIVRINDELVEVEAEIQDLKARKNRLEEEYKLLQQRCGGDEDKIAVLQSVMQDPVQISQHIQTDSYMKNSPEKSDGNTSHKRDYDRGTIVRVIGLGENAKRKFGKDLEVRATSYARHVNLNVKLNK